MTGIRRRRRKQLLDRLKERILEALDGSLWIIRLKRGCGPVVSPTTDYNAVTLEKLF